MATARATTERGAQHSTPGGEERDPLDRLTDRLDRARELDGTDSRPATSSTSADADPIDILRERIRDASDPAQWADILVERSTLDPDAAPEPLATLFRSIQRAHFRPNDLPQPDFPRPLDPEPDDPRDRLHQLIARERDELGARGEPLTERDPPTTDGRPSTGTTSPPGDTSVSEELLDALATDTLSGEVRARAARRLATIADDPTSEDVREVLRWLVTDTAPDRE